MNQTATALLVAACLTACAGPAPSLSGLVDPTSDPVPPASIPVRTFDPVQATWTGPLRTDSEGAVTELWEYTRDGGDARDADVSWADITIVDAIREGQLHWYIDLAGKPPAGVDPSKTVIAYGLVLEVNGDGLADYVVGIDNDAPHLGEYRVWVTDLATGDTDEQLGPPYGFPVEFAHPNEDPLRDPQMVFTFLPGSRPLGVDGSTRFYAWASVTEGDEVVAWDYAPDAAWIGSDPAAGLGAEPAPELGCTAVACPMPGPALMPPGSRQLVVSVKNDSERRQLLFVAQDEMPMGDLVGTAAPAMLLPGVTSRVVFTVPPGRGWAIFLNPTSTTGTLATANDIPEEASGEMPFAIEILDDVPFTTWQRPAPPGWFGN